MNCIIVDDEPLARQAVKSLVSGTKDLNLVGSFNNATSAADFMKDNIVDLVFLDIQMPGVTGLEFARQIPKTTLVIFTTAYAEYAVESYEMEAIDYLLKPIDEKRFSKAVAKALAYHSLLIQEEKDDIEDGMDYFFVKSERRYFKVKYDDILFVEGLKDYVILQMDNQRIITKMNLKTILDLLPKKDFIRISKSYIVNTSHIESFDNNDIYVKSYQIAIGNSYRDNFFHSFVTRSM